MYLNLNISLNVNSKESVAIADFDWSLHSELSTTRCSSGAEKVLGLLHLVGSYKNGSKTAGQNLLESYDPTKNKWSRMYKDIKIPDNGGCTVQVSPTDIVVISNYHNPGNLPIMYRINLAVGQLQNLRSPILEVRN